LSTKIQLALSTSGVQSACVSSGERVDMKIFPQLWEAGEWEGIQYIIADKGYDSQFLSKGILPQINKYI